MKLFKERSEKKSLAITTILSIALIFALLFFGLSYMEPPIESGITIRFGTSDVGSGDNLPEPVAPTPEEQPVSEQIETAPQETDPSETPEEVVTQTTEDAPVIEKKETAEKEIKTEETPKPAEKPESKPDKSTEDALQNILKGSAPGKEGGGGAGDDNLPGDKGDPSGDPDSDSYYGHGKGLDGDGNYRLGGRKALNKVKHTPNCNESGTVVVEVKVDQNGKVIQANPGVKGTTNPHSCLTEPAKRAALETKFNSDANAPSVQTGTIIYVFKLSD